MTLVIIVLMVVALGAVVAAVWNRRQKELVESDLASVHAALGLEPSDANGARAARRLTADLDESQARTSAYMAALDGLPVGVAVVSPNGTLQYANPRATSFFDRPHEGSLLASRVAALGQRVSTSDVAETIEMDVHEPDRRVLAITAIPAPPASGGESAFVYLEDLSERRRVDAMRADFVANASHELKTPLGALSLLAEALADAEDEESRVRLGQRLRAEAARMANVIDDVVQLAETQSLGSEYEPVSIVGVMEDAETSVRSRARRRGIELIRSDVVDQVVLGDRVQLTSAVTNLLNNAITYTAVKGEPGSVRFGAHLDGECVALFVADTGIGIPARYTDRVFERFFRVDRARSRESGGTGLGLSIVRNVALAHGGTVRVESSVGEGSTFTIELPITPEKE